MRWLPLASFSPRPPRSPSRSRRARRDPYAECAIRIEPGFMGTDIVRGPVGAETVLGGVGLWLSDLPEVVAGVPEAEAFAAQQQRLRGQSLLLLVGGGLLSSFALPLGEQFSDRAGVGAALTGLGLILYGGAVGTGAQRAQARAVWAYNRSLAE